MDSTDFFDFTDFFDALSDEIVIINAEGVIVAANAAWKDFCSDNGGEVKSSYVGRNYYDVCASSVGASSTEASIVPDGLRTVIASGTPFRCEYPCNSPTVKRWFELTASRLLHDGQTFAVVQHRNITTRHVERHDVEDAFVQSELLAALFTATSDAVLSYDLDGRINTWNRAAEALYGYSPEEAIGQSLELLYPPNWPKRVEQYRDEIIAGKLTNFEAIRIAKDGQECHVWVSCAPVRGPHGDIVAISNIHRDVTGQRKAEKSRKIIAQEATHRAKNILAVVVSIQRQTAKSATSLEEYGKTFGERIQSLSASTNLLVSKDWTTVRLSDLVKAQLKPFLDESIANTNIHGPDVVLQPQAVQMIGMALHELSTNSAKYGAMKTKGGKIDFGWEVCDTANASALVCVWRETGIICKPSQVNPGFGNQVLTSLAKSMLDAEVNYTFSEDSLVWNATIPAEHFARVGMSEAVAIDGKCLPGPGWPAAKKSGRAKARPSPTGR